MIDCIYWGLFFEGEEKMPKGTLENEVQHKHVTFGYLTPMPEHLLGTKSPVVVTGYGNDGRNEALGVELDPDIHDYHSGGVEGNRYHITLSTSKDGKPVDSGALVFDDLDRPYVLEGTFGYFDGKEIVCDR